MICRPCRRPADGSPVKFPVAPYASAASYFDAYAEEMARAAQDHRARCARPRGGDPARGLRARCPDVLVRQRRLGVDREPPAMRPREGRPDGDRPHPPRAEPQHQRRAAHRDSQRHGVRERLRLPASVPVGARRRAHRRLVIGPFAQHRARAYLGPRPRPAHHRDHRLRRRRRQDGGRGRHPRRLHELRHRRGPAPGHHARPGPVHPPVANERGRDLGDACSEP